MDQIKLQSPLGKHVEHNTYSEKKEDEFVPIEDEKQDDLIEREFEEQAAAATQEEQKQKRKNGY